MTEAAERDVRDMEIYSDILRAFGWAIVEFEDTLYRKYLMMSSRHSLTPREEFNRHLLRMHARGYISPLKLHGHKAWKKLVVEDRSDDSLVGRKIETVPEAPEKKPPHRRYVVSDSMILADDILRMMKTKMYPERDIELVRDILRQHASEMRRALCKSPESLLRYVDAHVPSLRKTIETILRSKGEDVLMLSLRLIETRAV